MSTTTDKVVEIKTSITNGCVQPHAGDTPVIFLTIFCYKKLSHLSFMSHLSLKIGKT
ncbi:MAG: hypothetical protein LBP59_01560 [Planctomycetaceae bacterium]|nr:hypothetical protein [Planctomycetaceae bacterium]